MRSVKVLISNSNSELEILEILCAWLIYPSRKRQKHSLQT